MARPGFGRKLFLLSGAGPVPSGWAVCIPMSILWSHGPPAERGGGDRSAKRSSTARHRPNMGFPLDEKQVTDLGSPSLGYTTGSWLRYCEGDWPVIRLNTRLKWVSDWKPTSKAISLTCKLGLNSRFLAFSIRTWAT